jgi:hypothetical protein
VVVAVVNKPGVDGGVWRIFAYHDDTAELLYREAHGKPSRTVVGRGDLYKIRRYLREQGIGEDGWLPEH